ncbi:ribonuclease H-like domain-containing protein [Tanacetum coccineum]
MPSLADLSFAGLDDFVYRPTTNKTSASMSQVETSISQTSNTSVEMPRVESVRPSGVIIEDWVSDDDEDIFQSNDLQATDKPSFKRIEFTNARNESVNPKQAEKPRIITQNPKSHSPIRRPFHKSTAPNISISNEKVNTVRVNGVNTGQTTVSAVKGNRVTAIKASAGCVWRPKMTNLNNVYKDNSGSWVSKRGNPQQALKNKGIFDSGCSRHMTGNKDFLIDYQDIDGGFVSFGGSARGGKITGKGKIRIDKKNSVLFTEIECLVLSPDFKLLDASRVLLRVPKQSNMYSFDLKNVVPSGDLTCLFAKATIDESKLWHRRLGHVNFKTMNKLVKGNLMLHIDLFGPTSVRSINHKTYCLVVTNDFSWFSWVFFLAFKDDTSGILKRFITEIENQLNHKVKVIRILVTKPQNKIPYELIIGRPPSISFMRPFGCPITILNTLDPLGKFDGKAEEGFLVGYFVNSKAFMVFNSQTRKVKENLPVNFLENKPNIAGQGPNWLFDVDSLINSRNYQPDTTGNQSNKNAGPQETNGNTCLKKNVDARQSEEKNVSTQQYIVC